MTADAFKKLIKSRQQSAEPQPPESPVEPISPVQPAKSSDFRQGKTSKSQFSESSSPTPQKKRGRPATGKRSDEGWIGRTFYVQRETDLDVEDELLNLKRQGVEIDKSELVDALLSAWVKWRHGEDSKILLGEISPRRKGK